MKKIFILAMIFCSSSVLPMDTLRKIFCCCCSDEPKKETFSGYQSPYGSSKIVINEPVNRREPIYEPNRDESQNSPPKNPKRAKDEFSPQIEPDQGYPQAENSVATSPNSPRVFASTRGNSNASNDGFAPTQMIKSRVLPDRQIASSQDLA